jgi:hypothetical protein
MFSVRPVFIDWITLLYQLPFQLFLTLGSGAFFGSLISPLHVFRSIPFFHSSFLAPSSFLGFRSRRISEKN